MEIVEQLQVKLKNTNKRDFIGTGEKKVLRIELNPGEDCKQDTTKKYSVILNLNCGESKEKIDWDQTSLNNFNYDNCVNTLTGTSKDVCPKFDFYVVGRFLDDNKWMIGAIFILLGLFELFLGKKLAAATTFILTAVAIVSISFVLFFQFIIPKTQKQEIVWVVLGISTVLGLVLGFFLSKLTKVFIALLGAFVGYLIGTLLYSFFFSRIDGNQDAILWITVAVCMLIGLLLAYFFSDGILISTTAIIGGYLIIRGISLYAEGFPNESVLVQLMKNGEYEEMKSYLNFKVYLYLIGWLVLVVIGIIVQININRETKDKDIDEKRINNTTFYFKMEK